MNNYIKAHRFSFLGALGCTLLSSLFAVILRFFKGDVLDCAASGQTEQASVYALLLIGFFCWKSCSISGTICSWPGSWSAASDS